MQTKKILTTEQVKELINTLKERFEKNKSRHTNLEWNKIDTRLQSGINGNTKIAEKLWSLNEMESTGGEPDIIGYDNQTDEYIFCDCSKESPGGRRSICYDHSAQDARKENKPQNNAMDLAADMGIEILSYEQYIDLQKLESFDTKTSSWVKTPSDIRQLGGALFAEFRYGHVFLFHNGAQSYYAARGFRGVLKV